MASKKYVPQPIPPFSTEKPHPYAPKEEKPTTKLAKKALPPPQPSSNLQRMSSDEDEKGKSR
jgi:hypothetical protein